MKTFLLNSVNSLFQVSPQCLKIGSWHSLGSVASSSTINHPTIFPCILASWKVMGHPPPLLYFSVTLASPLVLYFLCWVKSHMTDSHQAIVGSALNHHHDRIVSEYGASFDQNSRISSVGRAHDS